MVMATWAPTVFWILLVPLLVVMLIVYLRGKKFFRLVYITSVFTYAMTIMYWIDAYKLGRNSIIGLLVASSVLMIFIGWWMHKHPSKVKKPKQTQAILAVFSMAIILGLIGISASPIGWQVSTTTIESVKLTDIAPILKQGQPAYPLAPIAVQTVTITNTFITRQYELPQANACVYNTEKRVGQYIGVAWDAELERSDFAFSYNVIEVPKGSKTATLRITPFSQYEPYPTKEIPPQEPQVYDKLYLFLEQNGQYSYPDCSLLAEKDKLNAIVIPIV